MPLFAHLLPKKIRNNQIRVLENTELSKPKTKTIAIFLRACQIEGRTLFLGDGNYETCKDSGAKYSVTCDKHDNFIKSISNIPKVGFLLARNVSGYDVLIAKEIVVTAAALAEINEWLS